jgi:hypothetical protein
MSLKGCRRGLCTFREPCQLSSDGVGRGVTDIVDMTSRPTQSSTSEVSALFRKPDRELSEEWSYLYSRDR